MRLIFIKLREIAHDNMILLAFHINSLNIMLRSFSFLVQTRSFIYCIAAYFKALLFGLLTPAQINEVK